MSSSDNENQRSEETRLSESDSRADQYAAARERTAQQDRESTQHDRSKFAVILNELDLRSKKSNQWMTALSLIYVAVVLIVISVLYTRYSEVEKLVVQLKEDLAETKEAITKQASIHREQSDELLVRIESNGEVLDGMSKEKESLEAQLEEGGIQAKQLRQEADALNSKITKIDSLLEELSKRAEPFHAHYAIAPDKPQRFGQGKELDVIFGVPKSETLLSAPGDSESLRRFRIPASGVYMVSGWFSTSNQEEPPNAEHVVETEIRIDEIPFWSGVSLGNGVFTSGVPLRTGQFISIHATIRSSEESEKPAGLIERGEIRIDRLYYAPD